MNTSDVKHGNDMLDRARGLVLEAKRMAYDAGDLGACGAIDAAFAALVECRLVEPGQARLGQPPVQPAARHRPTPADRYQTDAWFHSLVATLEGLLAQGDFTPSELREAVILAATIYTQRTIRPMIFGPWKG